MWSMPVVLTETENENDSVNQNYVEKMTSQCRMETAVVLCTNPLIVFVRSVNLLLSCNQSTKASYIDALHTNEGYCPVHQDQHLFNLYHSKFHLEIYVKFLCVQ